MKDRQPTYPGRVQLVPVAGQENIYDMTMADEPTEEGTPPTKANLLSDTVATTLGFGGSDAPVINDVWPLIIKRFNALGIFAVMVLSPNGDPVEGATITGLNNLEQSICVTDSTGFAVGYLAGTSITINSHYVDLQRSTVDVSAYIGTFAGVRVTLAAYTEGDIIEFSNSDIVKFYHTTRVDVCLVGGGGAGGSTDYSPSSHSAAAGGGGGGGITNASSITVTTDKAYPLVVGAGGAVLSSSTGGSGGSSTFLGYAAAGGSGGGYASSSVRTGVGGTSGSAGAGNGGAGSVTGTGTAGGANTTLSQFGEGSVFFSGGGGGGSYYMSNPASGGAPNGASGSSPYKATSSAAGIGGGGGGASACETASASYGGGASPGGDGRVYVRLHC